MEQLIDNNVWNTYFRPLNSIFKVLYVSCKLPGFPDQVDHTLNIYETIQIIQLFLRSYHDQSGIIYDSEYDQPGTINFYGPV